MRLNNGFAKLRLLQITDNASCQWKNPSKELILSYKQKKEIFLFGKEAEEFAKLSKLKKNVSRSLDGPLKNEKLTENAHFQGYNDK